MEYDNGNRIYYVDPNDIRGNVNGVPSTPDYTDFSIWCNLIVERSSRLKNQIVGSSAHDDDVVIQFGMNATDGGKIWRSFNEGYSEDYNFLTTDYTNIDYGEVSKRSIIEGIQIESVDIGFTNYQTPQITIKFVDIRGGGFFGREEATHNEYGELTNLSTDENNEIIDDFYSCFVSFPYPKFKLQVKGFYGKDVTFQLTCTSFNGSFNVNTGNFEIVVQFIGYEYGILGDIPFELLVVAPQTPFGWKYFEEHRTKDEWALDSEKKEPPVRLKEFFQAVESEMAATKDEGTITNTDIATERVLLGINQQILELQNIRQCLVDFKKLVTKLFTSPYVIECFKKDKNGTRDVMYLYSTRSSVRIDKNICDKYNELSKLVKSYNESYASELGGIIPLNNIIPNYENDDTTWSPRVVELTNHTYIQNQDVFKEDGTLKTTEVYVNANTSSEDGYVPFEDSTPDPNTEFEDESQTLVAIPLSLYHETTDETEENAQYGDIFSPSYYNMRVIKLMTDKYRVIEGWEPKEIISLLKTKTWVTHYNMYDYAEYVTVIDFGVGGENIIDNRVEYLKTEYKNKLYVINNKKQSTIAEKVRMTPYIGRFYKMVMCHLETFIALFKNYIDRIYKEIDEGKRRPKYLGISSLDLQTDVPSKYFTDVPPFPAVYKKYSTNADIDEALNHGENIKANKWIGDFGGDWAEKDMVNEIYYISQNLDKNYNQNQLQTPDVQNIIYDGIDFIPFTFILGDELPRYVSNSIDGALLFIGLQAQFTLTTMGINRDDDAKRLGMYNAYIFSQKYPKSQNKNVINELASKNSQYIYDSIIYTPNANDNKFEYEFIPNKYNGRHPIFVSNSGNIQYVYLTKYNDNHEKELQFIPTVKCNSISNNRSVLFETYDIENNLPKKEYQKDYIVYGTDDKYMSEYNNDRQFIVITNQETVTKFKESYKSFQNNGVKIDGIQSSALANALKNNVLVDDNKDVGFIYNYSDLNKITPYKSITFNGIKGNEIGQINLNDNDNLLRVLSYVDTASGRVYNNVAGSGYLYPIYKLESEGRYYYDFFNYYFYLEQNTITDSKIRDKCKCLLFLNSLHFNFSYLINKDNTCFNKKDLTSGFETMPYGWLLLLGAYIWRKDYYKANRKDPILYLNNKKPTENQILWFKDGEFDFGGIISENTNAEYLNYNDIIKFKDPFIEKKLVKLFEDFTNTTFQEVKRCCELTKFNLNTKQTENLLNSDLKIMYNTLSNDPNIQTIQDATDALGNINYVYSNSSGNYRFTIKNFKGNYEYGILFGVVFDFLFKETNKIHQIIKQLRIDSCLVVNTRYSPLKKEINSTVFNNYLTGFAEGLEKVNKVTKEQETINTTIDADSEDARDFKCEIYLTLKNIWDRWLCGYYNMPNGLDYFKVNNFFNNSFVFIDSFYNNIYDVLKLNCQKVFEQYKSRNLNTQTHLGITTVAYLGGVAGDHMAMLFNFPDSVNFSEIGDNGKVKEVDMLENMTEIFTPVPTNKVGEPSFQNKFVFIYTHSANKLSTVDRNKFIHDSFDIWSFNQGTGVAPSIFKTPLGNPNESDEVSALALNSRIGYKVPAFGVAYSRQNNSIWKNIQISMDNFTVTEQAVRAESQIANKGNSEKHNITFYGQDIYSIYQSYSYLVTIEMMGDAQIQPLMYFQLMNVPMFRGTYMIIMVEHRITPGNMTTKFTGMKMSKVQPPYAMDWITKATKDEVYNPPKSNLDDVNDNDKIVYGKLTINIASSALEKAIQNHLMDGGQDAYCDNFVINVYNDIKKDNKNPIIGGDLVYHTDNNMLDYITKAKYKEGSKEKNRWSIGYYNPLLTPAKFSNLKFMSPPPVVGDLLFGYHKKKYGKPDHVSIYLGYHDGVQYVAEGLSRTGETTVKSADGIQVVPLHESRLSSEQYDSILCYAHCASMNIKQTNESNNYAPVKVQPNTSSNNNNNNNNNYNIDNVPEPVIIDSTDVEKLGFTFDYKPKNASLVSLTRCGGGEAYANAQTKPLKEGHTNLETGVFISADTIVNNLKLAVRNVFAPIRKEVIDGKNRPIPTYTCEFGFNSIFRSAAYNYHLRFPNGVEDKQVAKSSPHMYGQAADFQFKGNGRFRDNLTLLQTILTWLKNGQIEFCHLIIYRTRGKTLAEHLKTIGFMHIDFQKTRLNQTEVWFTNSGKRIYKEQNGNVVTDLIDEVLKVKFDS